MPNTHIWYGGPEVSYNSMDYLAQHNYIEGIMIGEGEETLCELIKHYEDGEPQEKLRDILGLVTRIDDHIISTGVRQYINMDSIPFVYKDLSEFENKIIYYESSRGCPYSCSYCLSFIYKNVRFRSLGLWKKELDLFL